MVNRVLARGDAAAGFDTTVLGLPAVGGTPGPIDLGSWGGSEAHYAAASGSSLTLRSMVATRGDSNQAMTSSSFNWTTIAGAGVSGLSIGDPFTATVNFHIDGRTAAGYGIAFVPGPMIIGLPADFALHSYVTARLHLDMYDLDSKFYEGGSPQASVNYVAAANVDSQASSPGSSPPDGFKSTEISHQVYLHAKDDSGAWDWTGNEIVANTYADAMPVKEVFDVNTGMLSLSVATFVGNRLNFEGDLSTDIYCSSYAPVGSAPSCAGLSDYGNTFDAELSSSVAGVTFSDYTPGVFAPVPEPESFALMLAGLVGVGLAAGRRRT